MLIEVKYRDGRGINANIRGNRKDWVAGSKHCKNRVLYSDMIKSKEACDFF